MYRIRILTMGKIKERWLSTAINEFIGRLEGKVSVEWKLFKHAEQLEAASLLQKNLIGLDASGQGFTSEEFSAFLISRFEEGGARLAFVIGGADGLSEAVKNHCMELVSLSEMTFTHQMARLIFLEQVYRAFEIERGSPYNK